MDGAVTGCRGEGQADGMSAGSEPLTRLWNGSDSAYSW